MTATSDCSRYVFEGLWAQLESLYRWCRSAVVLSRTAGSSSDRLYWVSTARLAGRGNFQD